jgi:glycosyltransferase involved in cell wall biosynthesis
MIERYQITMVISTYNRSEMLSEALANALFQESRGVPYEVIVVDNNSTDATREVVARYVAEGHKNLRYIFEPRQGVSYARNAGLASARSEIIAFADDDVLVAKDWIYTIRRVFEEHPDVDCIGGRVFPAWRATAPRWLTREHWMPLGLQDYGDEPLSINKERPLCLVSANLAFRREVFRHTGLFAPELQRIKDNIGSMEDAELLERYWASGRKCLYVPELIVQTHVTVERMTRAYHRRWHSGHGHFYAITRSDEFERSSSRLFDVPAHLYRQAAIDAAVWMGLLLGNRDRAFVYENRVRFFAGFFRKRRQDYLAADHRSLVGEIVTFLRSLASRRDYGEIPKELN